MALQPSAMTTNREPWLEGKPQASLQLKSPLSIRQRALPLIQMLLIYAVLSRVYALLKRCFFST